MRHVFQFGRRTGQPPRFQHLLVAATTLTVALRYCRMAQRDEENGFPCTAAMEWRKAAELCGPFVRVADHCWHRWERIMGMPRRWAMPIADVPAAQTPMIDPLIEPRFMRRFPYLRRQRLSASLR